MRQQPFSRSGIAIALLTLLCTILTTMPAYAQESRRASAHTPMFIHAHAAASEHVTIIVLDMSGSMSQNDPSGVRCSAANAYIDLSGPGDFIGVIGLDTSNPPAVGGPHQYEMPAWSIIPQEMDTDTHRKALRSAIASKSDGCRPDNQTPTYNSLAQALTMLKNATASAGAAYSGSVILLTDGLPCCVNPDQQVANIKTDLLPQFRQHNWPIDAIALGTGANFAFLKDIANATSGQYYSDVDSSGQASPLNIVPFFIDIFKTRFGRTPGPQIPRANLDDTAGSRSWDFTVGDFADHLDIIAVKDQQSTSITLLDPNLHAVSSATPGVFISEDKHYKIYSIDGPQQGEWHLTAVGSGAFLMDGLITSQFTVAILSPQVNAPVWPLGQTLTISAQILHQQTLISGSDFAVQAKLIKDGITLQVNKLSDSASPGTYRGSIFLPERAAPGAYILTVSISQTTSAPIAEASRSIRFELFPKPSFLSPAGQPTDAAVEATVVRWDPALQFIYGAPGGLMQWLGRWPLQNLPAKPIAVLAGVIQKEGQLYNLQEATLSASVMHSGSTNSQPAAVMNAGGSHFKLLLPSPATGDYTVTFQTSGSFEDSHGDSWTTVRPVRVNLQPASAVQEFFAWLKTLLYLACILFCGLLLRFFAMPAPSGAWIASEDDEAITSHSFNRSRRNLLEALLSRNTLYSQQAGMPEGIQFRFRGRVIEVRPVGRAGADWQRDGGTALSSTFQVASELRYRPAAPTGDQNTPTVYTLTTDTRQEQEERDYLDDYYDDAAEETLTQSRKRPGKRLRAKRRSERYTQRDEWYDDDE